MVSKGQFVGPIWDFFPSLHFSLHLISLLFLLTFNIIVVVVVSSLTYSLSGLVGCILICFNVTARCC